MGGTSRVPVSHVHCTGAADLQPRSVKDDGAAAAAGSGGGAQQRRHRSSGGSGRRRRVGQDTSDEGAAQVLHLAISLAVPLTHHWPWLLLVPWVGLSR